MKRFLFLILLFSFRAAAFEHQLELDLSSRQLEQILINLQKNHWSLSQLQSANQPELQRVIEVGKRNLDWLDHINSFRKEPLRFTKPGTLRSIPITDPKRYSDQTVVKEFSELVPTLLPEMKEVLLEGREFRNEPPLDVENYLLLGRKIDRLYQTALRWVLLSPYLPWYEQARQRDIRGIYFLMRESDLENKFNGWQKLSETQRAEFSQWLLMTCYNSWQDDRRCRWEFERAKKALKLYSFYQKFKDLAESTLDGFFRLQNPRQDVSWVGDEMKIDLLPIRERDRLEFVKINIEDEFKWLNWKLKIGFSNSASVQVIFEPGVNPHVVGLGGDLLYMDANAPLTEWDNQWTIRHEFGHVLGIPDCYVEFYDPNEKLMITYQIDVDDLMCSRAGKMNERLFLALKKAYQPGAPAPF